MCVRVSVCVCVCDVRESVCVSMCECVFVRWCAVELVCSKFGERRKREKRKEKKIRVGQK